MQDNDFSARSKSGGGDPWGNYRGNSWGNDGGGRSPKNSPEDNQAKIARITGAATLAVFGGGLAIAYAVNIQPHNLAAKYLTALIKELPFMTWISFQTFPAALGLFCLCLWLICSQKNPTSSKFGALVCGIVISIVWAVLALLSNPEISVQAIAVVLWTLTTLLQIGVYFRDGVFFKSVLAYVGGQAIETPKSTDSDAVTKIIASRNKRGDKAVSAWSVAGACAYAYEIGLSCLIFMPITLGAIAAQQWETFSWERFLQMGASSVMPEAVIALAVKLIPQILGSLAIRKRASA